MRKAEGVGMVVYPDQPMQEFRTFTCGHCGLPKRTQTLRADGFEEDGRHWCSTCDSMVCNACAKLRRCLPWERQMERAEARSRFRAAIDGETR